MTPGAAPLIRRHLDDYLALAAGDPERLRAILEEAKIAIIRAEVGLPTDPFAGLRGEP